MNFDGKLLRNFLLCKFSPPPVANFITIEKKVHKINSRSPLNPVGSKIVRLVLGSLEVSFEEFLNRVGVPLGDAERLHDVSFFVQQLDLRVEATQILDLKILKLGRPVGLDERLDLRVRPELAGAHFEDGFGVFPGNGATRFFLATFNALLLDLFKAEVFEVVAGRT